jgi:hypothetical protein
VSKILTRDGFVHLNLTCMPFHILHNVGGLVFLVLVAEHLLQGLGTSHHHHHHYSKEYLDCSLSLSHISLLNLGIDGVAVARLLRLGTCEFVL